MPLINSTYQPSYPFTKTHFNTVFRTFFSRIKINYIRERLELSDGDFMDLDIASVQSDTVIIALHGLEGSSESTYMLSLSKMLNINSVDVIAVNLRGCSGEHNRVYSSYHSGKTEDLEAIIKHVNKNYNYKNIILVGYSLGGNITLKYLGEQENQIGSKIKCAVAVSVPCDLTGSSNALMRKSNIAYMQRFLKTLKSKAVYKNQQFPASKLDLTKILAAKNFKDFDDLFTAPANGFKNAEDYWTKNSSKPFLKAIKIPTLMVSALDDTFLSSACFPNDIAKEHEYLFLETPKFGGHVGFNSTFYGKKGHWLEKRIIQ
ncbi:MAG: alpha/beta fold hydrolase, partial [Urechidicola sp.]|nr:alpha/beta fold hydrolase [Urechidicola sp.]